MTYNVITISFMLKYILLYRDDVDGLLSFFFLLFEDMNRKNKRRAIADDV